MPTLTSDFLRQAIIARNSALYSLFHHHKAIELDRTKIEAIQRKNFLKILKRALEKSEFYQTYYGDHGILRKKTIEIEDLPILTKEILMENFDSILSVKGLSKNKIEDFIKEGSSWIYQNEYLCVKSTGTSGYHTINVFTKRDFSIMTGLFLSRLPKHKPFGTKTAYLYGSDPSHLSYKFSKVSFPGVNTSKHIPTQLPISEMIKQLNHFNPDVISTMPSSLRILVNQSKLGNLKLKNNLITYSSGEMLEDDLKNEIKKEFGLYPLNIYGCIEAYPVAQDIGNQVMRINEDCFHVQAHEKGGIISNLINQTLPLLRFQNDDLLNIIPPASDDPIQLKQLIISDAKRIGSFEIKIKGKTQSLSAMVFKDTLYKYPNIIQNQIIQAAPSEFIINVYSNSSISLESQSIINSLYQAIKAAGINSTEIKITLKEAHPASMSHLNGKIKQYIPFKY